MSSDTRSIPVHTYDEMTRRVEAFATNANRKVLVISGDGGIGKTETVRRILTPIPDRPALLDDEGDGDEDGDQGEEARWWDALPEPPRARYLEGNVSPIEFYADLWDYRDEIFVLDDTDIHTQGPAVKLLKSVCNTRDINDVFWMTQNRELRKRGVPNQFPTRSRVLMLTNHWEILTKHLAAVADRGTVIQFEPTAREVHEYVLRNGICDDREILDFVSRHLDRIATPNLRSYKHAMDDKLDGFDWRETLLLSFAPTDDYEVCVRLIEDHSFGCTNDRIRAFMDETGKCRRRFFDHKKAYVKNKALNEGDRPGHSRLRTFKP